VYLHTLLNDWEKRVRRREPGKKTQVDVPSKGFMSASLAIVAEAPANARTPFLVPREKKETFGRRTMSKPLIPSLVPSRQLLHRLEGTKVNSVRRTSTKNDRGNTAP
jgi:hypothetical protein